MDVEIVDQSVDSGTDGVLVRAHPGLCVGWGNCHRFAPEVYPLDANGLVDVDRLAVPANLAYEAHLGASACPEEAITVRGLPMGHWVERRVRP